MPSRLGLAAGPGAFQKNRARGGETVGEFPIGDAGTVVSCFGQGAVVLPRGTQKEKLASQQMYCNDYNITFAMI